MKLMHPTSFRFPLLVVLLVLVSGSALFAQDTLAKFTLPMPVSWGQAQLPPDHYTIRTYPAPGHWLLLSNSHRSYFVPISYMDDVSGKAKSQLLVVTVGSKQKVHVLYLSHLRKAFYFNVPVKFRVDTKVLAEGRVPSFGKSISVTEYGK